LSKLKKNDDSTIINKINDNNSSKTYTSKNEIDLKDKINENKVSKKEVAFNNIKTKNTTSICSDVIDCDIDKITEFLIKRGKEKDFPDITSK